MSEWTIGNTGDKLLTNDARPLGRVRERMRRDAERWGRQGLTFEGLSSDLMPDSGRQFLVKGNGYELRTTQRDGFWPVDALRLAASSDWTEVDHE